jgi:hypothetical protein
MTDATKSLVVTRMDGPKDSDQSELKNPRWSDIESAVRRLDGNSCSLLILGIGKTPVPHMAIGGGEAGKYIVYVTTDNLTFTNLINLAAAQGRFSLVAGGQRGEYDLRLCVSLSDALRAAKHYAETGRTDPTLTWEIS